jgi:hypothetical protein
MLNSKPMTTFVKYFLTFSSASHPVSVSPEFLLSNQPKMNIAISFAPSTLDIQHIILKHNICSREAEKKVKRKSFMLIEKCFLLLASMALDPDFFCDLRRAGIKNIFI